MPGRRSWKLKVQGQDIHEFLPTRQILNHRHLEPIFFFGRNWRSKKALHSRFIKQTEGTSNRERTEKQRNKEIKEKR
jgi:hypothetical protein